MIWKFIKLTSQILMFPLADLFNLSLSTCTVPQICQSDGITPLFKGGDQPDVNNYHPISIICEVANISNNYYFNINYLITIFYPHINLASDPIFSFTITALLKIANDVCSLVLITVISLVLLLLISQRPLTWLTLRSLNHFYQFQVRLVSLCNSACIITTMNNKVIRICILQ